MQLFSMQRLCTEEEQKEGHGYPCRQGPPDSFKASGDAIIELSLKGGHRGSDKIAQGLHDNVSLTRGPLTKIK